MSAWAVQRWRTAHVPVSGRSCHVQNKDAEYRPYQRRVPEFKFWYSLTKAVVVAFCMTFFSVFNIPVFWYRSLALSSTPA